MHINTKIVIRVCVSRLMIRKVESRIVFPDEDHSIINRLELNKGSAFSCSLLGFGFLIIQSRMLTLGRWNANIQRLLKFYCNGVSEKSVLKL